MRDKIIVIKNNIVVLILLIAIIFFVYSLFYKKNIKQEYNVENTIETINIEKETIEKEDIVTKEIKPNPVLPNNIDGFPVIGKLEIPKINLSTYILSETNEDTLDKSVTKLCGPRINEMGNFCILGHNFYRDNMFGNLKKVEKNDVIILSNIYGQEIEYLVYDIYKIYPDEVECLSQETNGNRDVTLITCTTGGIRRLVVKATEIYD